MLDTFSPPLPMIVAASGLEITARIWIHAASSWAVAELMAVADVDATVAAAATGSAAPVADSVTGSASPPFVSSSPLASGSVAEFSLGSAGVSISSSLLEALSRAGRLASGWSVALDGEEASSRGRFADCVGWVGEADMFAW